MRSRPTEAARASGREKPGQVSREYGNMQNEPVESARIEGLHVYVCGEEGFYKEGLNV